MVNRLVILGKEAGLRGLFAGLGPRMSASSRTPRWVSTANPGLVMTAGLVSSQFIMYGSIKSALGAGEGVTIHKEA